MKPHQRTLSKIEQMNHQNISSIRVAVEHHMGGIKRCQILVQLFRNWVDQYDGLMETVCDLHNFQLTHRKHHGNTFN